jgi:urea transport system ATP-binding protein
MSEAREKLGTMLYLNGVSVSFDGFRALNNLSIIVHPAEMLAIIGPNGAGKTTMMDIITGKTRPDDGDVYFDGRTDLTKLDEAKIANLGIGRKFQKPTVFESQSVWDNLVLALKKPRGVFASLAYHASGADTAPIEEILATVRLTPRKTDLAADLSHGQKQWLEIGMLLAQDPKLLLVDEPVAGMTDSETVETAKLLKEIAKTRSVVVVEHDMSFVRDLGSRVTCLAEGSVLAEGTLEQVSANPMVIERYLGR